MQIKPHKDAMNPIQILGVIFFKTKLLGISLCAVNISVYNDASHARI
jgi:hypothetical protein